MLVLNNISKSFGKSKILDNISLTINPGEILGFLGPNGAGKSTTIKTILGLVLPDSGNVEYLGKPLKSGDSEFYCNVGVMIEEPALIAELSGWQNIAYSAKLRGVDLPVNNLIDKALNSGLSSEDLKKKIKNYSTGMKQRLSLAITLLHDPQILIYDEPTNGLDPHGIRDMRATLKTLAREKNKAIFISSHLLSEVEKTCDRVEIINKGKIIAGGTVEEVIRKQGFTDLEEAFLELTA